MMNERILEHYRDEFRDGFDLEAEEAETLFDAMISHERVLLIAELLGAWNAKGISADEIYALAAIMRSRMVSIDTGGRKCIDIVGTGGSPSKTFNVSTATAFVVAGAGLVVAKHGNRAATSNSGSSDVLSALGIEVDLPAQASQARLDRHGLCFMFAPRFHSLSPALAKARRSLGEPTIFNYLGPLCNPAGVDHQLLGVANPLMLKTVAAAAGRLGTARTWIVNGAGSFDEIACDAETSAIEVVTEQEPRHFVIKPNDLGVSAGINGLETGCGPVESARIIAELLDNKMQDNKCEHLVLINAAAALVVAGEASSLEDAVATATESLRSGAAKAKLESMRDQ